MSVAETPRTAAALPRGNGILFAIAQSLRTMLHRAQVGRMKQALYQLPAENLAAIGITRQDIPEYAERLLRDE